ncbi:2Fe-2S iron-sulfur cluster-binding protein [Corynebacterium alimapuense]|uniref:(2Fe-2S)-binding protein n=1 Tax=Corynebacterium alimapuense TaxID=1576874 RepID=A0A3M8KAF7_9CORY|nr:2Fe-2S iron-sulfur cluster binding domain-containing protein [Corynebacterium alimapuense]RNE49849.1 (2Fe-2S)-binding protein [Corynebacterium alimapuense]
MNNRADIDGTEYQFPWPEGETLLSAMLAESIPAHFSCTAGNCGTCQCTLTGGSSHMENNGSLSPYEINHENQTLACQTIRDEEGPYFVSYD